MAQFYGQRSKYLSEQTVDHQYWDRVFFVTTCSFIILSVVVIVSAFYLKSLMVFYFGLSLSAVSGYFSYRLGEQNYVSSKKYIKGQKGEAEVAGELVKLPNNYSVFYDLMLPGKHSNIDIVVTGPTGIYSIEVKNYSILSQEAILSAIMQAEINSLSLQNYLDRKIQNVEFVKPILVFANNLSYHRPYKLGKFCYVMNKSQINNYILRGYQIKQNTNIEAINYVLNYLKQK